MFKNIFYIGYLKNHLLKGELRIGKHEPLVSEEIFLKVNGLLDQNPKGWRVCREKIQLPLKGFCKCEVCGGPLTGYVVKKFWYYRCKNSECSANVNATHLNKLFTEKLQEFKLNPAIVPALQRILESTYKNLNESDSKREKPLKEQITKLKNELDALEENLAFGRGVTKEMYDKYSAGHKERIAQIDKELELIHKDGSRLGEYIKTALEGADNMLQIWELLDYKGKQRLQYLVFPKGIVYNKTKKSVLVPAVNPIFSVIQVLARGLEPPIITNLGQEEELSHSIYWVFQSSSDFWIYLLSIIEFFEPLKKEYLSAWKSLTCSYYTTITGDTQSNQVAYVSDISDAHYSGASKIENGSDIPVTNLIFSGTNNTFNRLML